MRYKTHDHYTIRNYTISEGWDGWCEVSSHGYPCNVRVGDEVRFLPSHGILILRARINDVIVTPIVPEPQVQTVSNVLVFSNGNIAAFDGSGEQIPELQQKNVIELWNDYARSLGYDTQGCVVKCDGYSETIDNGQECQD